MSGTREQVISFLEACEELKKCKFIMATTKIKDILKCIVNSPELYNLFDAVTQNFNYPSAKEKCLVTLNDGLYISRKLILPQTVGQRIAFVFCLLVEFDRETLNFNDFLRTYFPEDGSYYASYHAFCDVVIKGLQDAVAQVFREQLEQPENIPLNDDSPESGNYEKSSQISAINLIISDEMQYVSGFSSVPDDEREGGIAILTQLFEAVKSENKPLINALLCGYNYFVMYNKCVSDCMPELIRAITDYEENI